MRRRVAVIAAVLAVAVGVLLACDFFSAPSRAEREAMALREKSMMKELESTPVIVLPVAIHGSSTRYDADAAAAIAEALNRRGYANVRAAREPVEIPYKSRINESAVYWQRFRELAESFRSRPWSDCEYVVQVDIFGDPAIEKIGAVHAMSVTSRGEMAFGELLNSHQALYREFSPRNVDDVVKMVATQISRRHEAVH